MEVSWPGAGVRHTNSPRPHFIPGIYTDDHGGSVYAAYGLRLALDKLAGGLALKPALKPTTPPAPTPVGPTATELVLTTTISVRRPVMARKTTCTHVAS